LFTQISLLSKDLPKLAYSAAKIANSATIMKILQCFEKMSANTEFCKG
jgi:hypothetical protein